MMASSAAGRAQRLRSLVLPGILALGALAVLVALGSWQLNRLAWKQALIAQVEARAAAEPVPLAPASAWTAMSAETDDYRKVRLTGTFRHNREAYLYHVAGDTRTADRSRPQGQGWFVMTPMDLAGGGTVIVNRGFVPTERRDPASRAAGQVGGTVTVDGLVRFPEIRTIFAASDDAARRLFYTRDIAAMAQAMGLTGAVAPFSVDADARPVPGGLPVGGETRLVFANRHFEYALTWFGLALTLIGVFAAFAVQKLRGA
ncbi:SURF1 family protein [Phreatobacter sp.]|uniref:SURF1 family protein n=1 Tax=Phreatobacter sp. TaxID=1966341 RepID=UPI003F730E7E